MRQRREAQDVVGNHPHSQTSTLSPVLHERSRPGLTSKIDQRPTNLRPAFHAFAKFFVMEIPVTNREPLLTNADDLAEQNSLVRESKIGMLTHDPREPSQLPCWFRRKERLDEWHRAAAARLFAGAGGVVCEHKQRSRRGLVARFHPFQNL